MQSCQQNVRTICA